MSNGVLAAPTSVPDVAASVYPIPRWSIERPLNVASPRTAFTVVVPASVPLPGSVAIATVTVLVAPTTVLPTASWMATTTAGLIATPATALLGWTVKASVGGGWVGPVSPPHATTASQLPSNGTTYTVLFTVLNTGNNMDSYDLLTAKRPGTAISVASIAGTGVTHGANPDSARLANIDVGASAAGQVRRGQAVWLPRSQHAGVAGEARLHGPGGDLLAVGAMTGALFRPAKVLAG